jgi:hypothetical protein
MLRWFVAGVVATPLGWSYGLGLMKVREACGDLWGHEGGSPGYASQALGSKDRSRQVIVLTNLTGGIGAAGLFGVRRGRRRRPSS